MSSITTTGRRGIAVAFAAVILTTAAACGSQTEVNETSDAPVLGPPPGVVQQPVFPMSADAAERNAWREARVHKTDRTPQFPPTSADAAERNGQQKSEQQDPGPTSADTAERLAQDPRLRK